MVKEAGPQSGPGCTRPRDLYQPSAALSNPRFSTQLQSPLSYCPPSPFLPRPCTTAGSCQLWEPLVPWLCPPLQWLTPGSTCFFLVFHTFLPKMCAPLAQSFKNTVQLLLVGNSFLSLLLYLPYPLASPASGWFLHVLFHSYLYISRSPKRKIRNTLMG